MTDHEFYAVLCTLAATGQLAASERPDFDEHCLHCSACRDQFQELLSIGKQLQLDAAIHATFAPMPAGSLERFRARAIREGIAPRSAPARPSLSSVLATAAATFVVVAALVFMPHERKTAENIATSTTERISSPENLSAPVTGRTRIQRHARTVYAHALQRGVIPHTDMGADDANRTDQRFSQAIVASYPFFEPQSTMKPSVVNYSALGRSQISRLDFFRNLDDFNSRSAGGAATARPIDIASTGNVFDFSANIRQLHFQLSSVQ